MATYKGIQGYTVQKLSSDPTVADTVGQLWYNSSAAKFKISTEGAGAWASGPTMLQAQDAGGSCGIQTAAMFFGGRSPSTSGITDSHTYNGTAWTETANLLVGVYTQAGFGTTTAAMSAGGDPAPPSRAGSVSWNGTSWTAANDLQLGRRHVMGCGTQTAGLISGGTIPATPGSTYREATELYDGTSWAAANKQTTAASLKTTFGTTTAAIAAGGTPVSAVCTNLA